MGAHKLHFLLIDSKKDEALYYQKLLNEGPFLHYQSQFSHAANLTQALSIIEKKAFHLILTNIALDDAQGMEIVVRLQVEAPHTPIIILTEQMDEKLALEAISRGVQDFIPKKELSVIEFSRIVGFAIERHYLQEAIRDLSFKDELTTIFNRRGFATLAEQQIELSKRMKKGFFLFLFDLDFLKHINDTFGHSAGDRALKETGECLKRSFRSSDIIGRIGGDEFAALALNVPKENDPFLLSNIEKTFQEFNKNSSLKFNLSISSGYAYYDPEGDDNLETLVEKADQLLYEMKRQRHSTIPGEV